MQSTNVFRFSIMFVITLLLGVIYSWTLFVEPLRIALNWDIGKTSDIFTISIICNCAGNFLGGWLNRKWNTGYIYLCSAIMLFSGFYMISLTTDYIQFVLYYGVLCSCAIGMSYNTILSSVPILFPERISTMSGILLMAYGGGTFVFGSIIQYLLTRYYYGIAFKFIAVAFSLVMLVGIIFLKTDISKKTSIEQQEGISILQALYKADFYVIYLWGILISAVGMFVIGKSTSIISAVSSSTSAVLFIVPAVSIFNGIFRFISGVLFDVLPHNKMIGAISFSMFTGIIIMTIGSYMLKPSFCVAGVITTTIAFACMSPTLIVFTKQFFGIRYYSSIFALMASEIIPGALLGSTLTGKIISSGKTFAFCEAFLAMLGFIAVILVFRIMKIKRLY